MNLHKRTLMRFILTPLFILNLCQSSQAQSWGIGLSFSPSQNESSPNLLIERTSKKSTIITGGISLIRQRVEELITRILNNNDSIQTKLNELINPPPISIFQSVGSKNCSSKKACYPQTRFVGSLSPIVVGNNIFYMTAKHVLVGPSKVKKTLYFDPQLDLSHFKIFEFDTDKLGPVADMLLLIPNTFIDSHRSCNGNQIELNQECLNEITSSILPQFTEPKENSFWISIQPVLESQAPINWLTAAGWINSTHLSEDQILKTDSLYPVFSIINNFSNHANPGVSGNLIRNIIDETNTNKAVIGNFLGLILCKTQNHTIVLNIPVLLNDTALKGRVTTIEQLLDDSISSYEQFSGMNCDPINGRNGGGF